MMAAQAVPSGPGDALLKSTLAALEVLKALGHGPETALLSEALEAWHRQGWAGWRGLGAGAGWLGLGDHHQEGWGSLPDAVASVLFRRSDVFNSSHRLVCADWAR